MVEEGEQCLICGQRVKDGKCDCPDHPHTAKGMAYEEEQNNMSYIIEKAEIEAREAEDYYNEGGDEQYED